MILNQRSSEINFEEKVIVLDEVDFYQIKNQRVRFYQVEQMTLCADRTSGVVQQITEKEVTIVDNKVTTDSFDDVVPTGFLPLLLCYAQQRDFFSLFDHLNIPTKEVKYSHLDMVKTLIAAIACGCSYIKDINYKLRPYRATANLIGLNIGFPEQSQVNRFLKSFDFHSLSRLVLIFDEAVKLLNSRKKVDIFDYDATGLVTYGKTYEFSKKGYVSKKRGDRGYILSAGYAHNYILANFLDPGNTNHGSRFWDSIYAAADIFGFDNIGMIRADGIQGTGPNIEELIKIDKQFIIRGYHPSTAKNFSKGLYEYQWSTFEDGVSICDIGWQRITNCKYPVRVILQRYYKPKKKEYIFRHIYCNNTKLKADEIVLLYNDRIEIESMYKSSKNGLHINKLNTRNYLGLNVSIYFTFLVHNLITSFRKEVLSKLGLEDIGINEITRRLMDIPAKVGDDNLLIFPEAHPYVKRLLYNPHL